MPVFGARCILCAGPARGRDLCDGCHADLPWSGPACDRCAFPLPAAGTCGRCLLRPLPHARTVAALRYAYPVDRLILALKFSGRLAVARVLGELLADTVPDRDVELIVPVPLHPSRIRERGFNQALEIARPVARATGIRIASRTCVRTRSTQPQSALEPRARRRNVRGAFKVVRPVAGRMIAVVDDVYTTGHTVSAVAMALLAAGATRVEVWCVARAGVRDA